MAAWNQDRIARAQDEIRLAARWLALLHFQVDPSKPILSPCISTYHDLAAPSADELRRLCAAKAMLKHVRRQVVLEGLKGEQANARARQMDSYGLVWKTTERGAARFAVEALLSSGMALFNGSQQKGV